ncbi:MAG: hypothetical protein GYA51_13025 [Candidatus Methanofastidiosa archaeon]|nr:hypothetical protein [Candidatus Methanofastidiosa archaeon]
MSINKLEIQRDGIEKYFHHAKIQLELSRLYSTVRIQVIKEMTLLMRDKTVSLYEKKLAQETILAMSNDLTISMNAGTIILSKLIESSNKNLEDLPSLNHLLTNKSSNQSGK